MSRDIEMGGWNLGGLILFGDPGVACLLSDVCVEYSVINTFLSWLRKLKILIS